MLEKVPIFRNNAELNFQSLIVIDRTLFPLLTEVDEASIRSHAFGASRNYLNLHTGHRSIPKET